MLSLQPSVVQIISWNDFDDSHYISDMVSTQLLPSAKHYVEDMFHSGFRALLPYYISA